MEDPQLVAGLLERREDAVEAFLVRYRPLFFHCIGHFETEASAREDLFQEVVVHVLERLDRGIFDPLKGSFGTWLYRVAWCRCADIKRRARGVRTARLTTTGDRVPERADAGPGPGEEAGTEELGGVVRRAMARLDEEDRRLLTLRFVEGRSMAEIGAELSISVEQTKYRLKRASAGLRKVLLNDMSLEDALR